MSATIIAVFIVLFVALSGRDRACTKRERKNR